MQNLDNNDSNSIYSISFNLFCYDNDYVTRSPFMMVTDKFSDFSEFIRSKMFSDGVVKMSAENDVYVCSIGISVSMIAEHANFDTYHKFELPLIYIREYEKEMIRVLGESAGIYAITKWKQSYENIKAGI
jgi:hypothetical protein